MRAYTVPVKTPAGLPVRIELSVVADNKPYDLTGATVALEIWDTRSDDRLVYSAYDTDAVITVSDIVTVEIPADTAVYADLETGYRYRYGLTVVHPALDFRMQGDWKILHSYGPVEDTGNQWVVSSTDATVTISGGVGPRGVAGDEGPAGPWETTSRLITASGPILATDTLVISEAGGGDIVLTCPAPADLWDGTNGRVIVVARKWADTGTVTITGTADGLPIELFSSEENGGESIWITTYDGVNLVIGDAPFVIQVSGGGGFLALDFVAADLVAGGLPLPVSVGSVLSGSFIKSSLVRFAAYFDTKVGLSVGQSGEKYPVYDGDEEEDGDGYLTHIYREFSGVIILYPEFTASPVDGAGTIYLTF